MYLSLLLFLTIYRNNKVDRSILAIMSTINYGLDHLTKFELALEYNTSTTFHFIPASTTNLAPLQKSLKKLEVGILLAGT